jgi:hypothetical protein
MRSVLRSEDPLNVNLVYCLCEVINISPHLPKNVSDVKVGISWLGELIASPSLERTSYRPLLLDSLGYWNCLADYLDAGEEVDG